MKPYLWVLAMLIMIALPVFSHLDQHPLHMWDEARLATNAIEMHQSGNWLVTTFNRTPDMWNTKPPAMIWLMVLSIKAFGMSELALRLPAAISGVFCLILVFWFCAKKLNNSRLAFLSCMVLITSQGFVDWHRIRTADYDSLLTLTTTAYCLFYYLYLKEGKNRYFIIFSIALIAAALTKGVAGLLFLPALFLFTLYSKQLRTVLTDKRIYAGILAFCTIVIGYYVLRDQANPGYIKAVFENELGGRYMQTLEEHKAPFSFYLYCLHKEDFRFWFMLTPFGMTAAYLSGNEEYKKMAGYLLLLAISYLLIISTAQTRIEWYAMPAFPFLAMITGFFLDYGWSWITRAIIPTSAKIGLTGFLVFMLWQPYNAILKHVMYGDPEWWTWDNYALAAFMSDALHGRRDIKGYTFTNDCAKHQNILAYYEMMEKDHQLKFKRIDSYSPGDTVVTCKPDVKRKIEAWYSTSIVYSKGYIKVYKINGLK